MNFKEEAIISKSETLLSTLHDKIANEGVENLTDSDKQLIVQLTNMLQTRRISKNVAFWSWVCLLSLLLSIIPSIS